MLELQDTPRHHPLNDVPRVQRAARARLPLRRRCERRRRRARRPPNDDGQPHRTRHLLRKVRHDAGLEIRQGVRAVTEVQRGQVHPRAEPAHRRAVGRPSCSVAPVVCLVSARRPP